MNLLSWLFQNRGERKAAENRLASAFSQHELSTQLQECAVADLQTAVDRHCETTREGTKLLNKLKIESGEKAAVECQNCVFFCQTNCVRGRCTHPRMQNKSVEAKWHCEFWKVLAAT